mgnify:CR=1 FL=1
MCRKKGRVTLVGDVGINIKKLGNSSIRYEIGIFKKNEEDPCAVGYFVHVYVNRNDQKKIEAIPINIYNACNELLNKS